MKKAEPDTAPLSFSPINPLECTAHPANPLYILSNRVGERHALTSETFSSIPQNPPERHPKGAGLWVQGRKPIDPERGCHPE